VGSCFIKAVVFGGDSWVEGSFGAVFSLPLPGYGATSAFPRSSPNPGFARQRRLHVIEKQSYNACIWSQMKSGVTLLLCWMSIL